MRYALILAIINLVPAAVQCQQEQYHEVSLINRLNDFFGFDHNIFLLDRTLDPDRYVATSTSVSDYGKFTPQSVYIFENGSRNKNIYVKNISSKDTLLIVALEALNSANALKILAEVKRIHNLQVTSNVKIGVFVARKNVTSTHILERLFRWSWSVGIVNTFCAFHTNVEDTASSFNVFRFDPFGTLRLINVTGSESLQNYFPDKVPNYRQDPLRFVRVYDIINNDLAFNLWVIVVRVFNASMLITEVRYEDYVASEGTADIVHNEEAETKNLRIYPHRITGYALLVPHARPYSEFVAYLQNGSWKLLIAYTFIIIVSTTLLLTVSGYLQTKKILVFQCAADVINLLMNDNGAVRYGQLHCADICVIVPLTFTGLIVVNGIVSVFQSYLTVPIYERQINTIDDLFESRVPILINEINWVNRAIGMLEDVSKHGGWSDKVHPTNMMKIRIELNKFNSSISSAVPENQVRIYLEVQKRLGIKAYHFLTKPLEKHSASFKVKANFPFTEPINDLIHRLQCAGLLEKWLKDSDEAYIKMLWKMNFNRTFNTSYESGSAKFTLPTVVWCGWIASVILFACEIIWNKLKSKFKPHIEKLKTKFLIDKN